MLLYWAVETLPSSSSLVMPLEEMAMERVPSSKSPVSIVVFHTPFSNVAFWDCTEPSAFFTRNSAVSPFVIAFGVASARRTMVPFSFFTEKLELERRLDCFSKMFFIRWVILEVLTEMLSMTWFCIFSICRSSAFCLLEIWSKNPVLTASRPAQMPKAI